MKKITVVSLILILFSVTASAQRGPGIRKQRATQGFHNGQVTRPERVQLRNDVIRLKMVQRNAKRDGVVTPIEKRRINKMKCNTRRDAFRFKHNGRNRVI